MVLKLGQNTSIGCKLKVLKAKPTKWSRKKVIRIKEIEARKIVGLRKYYLLPDSVEVVR